MNSINFYKSFMQACYLNKIGKRFNSTEYLTLINLKKKFSILDKPNYYNTLVVKNPAFAKLKRASVLIPISVEEKLDENGRLIRKSFFTLTKRTDKMKSFKGDVCFIGGKRDSTDEDDSVTALREAREEANIDSNHLTILAQLCPIITFNQTLVTPIVAYFDKKNFEPILSVNEVEMIFELPTERFLSKSNHRMSSIKNENGVYSIHYFKDNINGKSVSTWGFTAFLSVAISSFLHSRATDFEFVLNLNENQNKRNLNEMFEEFSSNKLAVSQAVYNKKQ
jgi:8-oxo-dGTP pyrophosphatase MutT (NUDIX family)